jgi:hypothetical protein
MAAYADDGFRPAKATMRMAASSRIVIFTEAFARRSVATDQDKIKSRSKSEDEEEDGKDRARARARSRF